MARTQYSGAAVMLLKIFICVEWYLLLKLSYSVVRLSHSYFSHKGPFFQICSCFSLILIFLSALIKWCSWTHSSGKTYEPRQIQNLSRHVWEETTKLSLGELLLRLIKKCELLSVGLWKIGERTSGEIVSGEFCLMSLVGNRIYEFYKTLNMWKTEKHEFEKRPTKY